MPRQVIPRKSVARKKQRIFSSRQISILYVRTTIEALRREPPVPWWGHRAEANIPFSWYNDTRKSKSLASMAHCHRSSPNRSNIGSMIWKVTMVCNAKEVMAFGTLVPVPPLEISYKSSDAIHCAAYSSFPSVFVRTTAYTPASGNKRICVWGNIMKRSMGPVASSIGIQPLLLGYANFKLSRMSTNSAIDLPPLRRGLLAVHCDSIPPKLQAHHEYVRSRHDSNLL